MHRILVRLVLILIAGYFMYSCKPSVDKITTDQSAHLEFSRDTVLFDTIFTSIGSATRRLTVYNPNDKAVVIGSIKLGGLSASDYKLIINGRESVHEDNLELRGKDSIFILVRVNINPQDEALPYLVKDSLIFNTNNNQQKVMLVAHGQDAHFINNKTLSCNTIWDSPKPYVISGHATIPEGCNLTIKPGTRVFFSNGAYLQVNGSLKSEGEIENRVAFSSDKLGHNMKNQPGLWKGIIFSPNSQGNSLKNTDIRNAVTGIFIENSFTPISPVLTVEQSVVENMSSSGIEAVNSNILLQNSLIQNCADYAFLATGGGKSKIVHCTMANYSFNFFRNNSTLGFINSRITESGSLKNPIDAEITNSIIWGDRNEEVTKIQSADTDLKLSISHSIIKTFHSDEGEGNLYNEDPKFIDPRLRDLKLTEGSPAINGGTNAGFAVDLIGKTRNSPPDIGAYEFSPNEN